MRLLGTLRNTAHTGENRCVPCTIVNLGILWLVVNGLGLFGRFLVGGGVLVLGLLVIWLRGYLVPFTPRFAPWLVDRAPVPTTWFHDTRETGALSGNGDEDQLVEELVRAGVVDVGEERVYLDSAFERRWHEEMDRLADRSPGTLADELSRLQAIPGARPVDEAGQRWIAIDGQTSLVPHHVAVAELGAARALESVIDDPGRRLAMARPLREFLTDCPVCDSPFEQSTEVACCGGHTAPRETPKETLVCPTCEQRFLTLQTNGS